MPPYQIHFDGQDYPWLYPLSPAAVGVALEDHDVYESGNGGYIQTHTFPDITANGADPYVLAFGIPRVSTDITSWAIEGSTPTSVDSRIATNVAGVDVRGRLVGGGAITNVIGTSGFKLMAGVVASFNNVDQTAPTAGSNSAEGYGTTASLSYTGTAGNLLVVCISTQDDRTISGSNCTNVDQISHADSNLGSAFMGIVEATGSPQTIGGTWAGDTVWVVVVVELRAAGAPSTTGQIKVWGGSAWGAKPIKVWNGSAWVTKPLKRWNGSTWVETPY